MVRDPQFQEPDTSQAGLVAASELLCVLHRLPRCRAWLSRRGCAVQVRAGTGGDEAALFAMDLFRMYQRHVAAQGWRWEQLSLLETEVGPPSASLLLSTHSNQLYPFWPTWSMPNTIDMASIPR